MAEAIEDIGQELWLDAFACVTDDDAEALCDAISFQDGRIFACKRSTIGSPRKVEIILI
jgi:hypothetical protein